MRIQYTLSGLLLSLTVALILEGALALPLLYGWLIALNVFTFLFYGIDKLNSRSSSPLTVRIPEFALLFLALAGGSPAALLATVLFTHKISKVGFMLSLLLIVVAQAAAAYYYRESIPWPWLTS